MHGVTLIINVEQRKSRSMLEIILSLLFMAWLIAWIVSFHSALSRPDIDPTTRLLRVVVLIFVPVPGILFYWVLATPKRAESAHRIPDEPTNCFECNAKIPEGATSCPS